MANYAILYCIGNRDIKVNGSLIDKGKIRNSTKEILDSLNSKNNDFIANENGEISLGNVTVIELPIFSTVLNEIKSKYDLDSFDDIHYYLIGTDQNDKLHNMQDTVYLAQIFRLYLEKLEVSRGNITIDTIKSNPAIVDETFKYFKNFLKHFRAIPKFSKLFVILGPGTPAMNMAMINVFSTLNNAVFFHTNEEAGKTVLKRLDFNKILRTKTIKSNVLSLIHAYDYPSAETLYSELPDRDTILETIIKALSYRVNFEFDKAVDCLNNCTCNSTILEDLSHYLLKLKNKKQEYVMKELYYEFSVRIKSKRYLEAIGMTFRLEEQILKYVVEKILGIEISSKDNFESFKNKVNSIPELKDFLANEGTRYDEPNRRSYRDIIRFFAGNIDKMPSRINFSLEEVLDFADKIDPRSPSSEKTLPQLRNHTPFGHGFEGVSEEKIREIYPDGPDVLVYLFQTVLKKLGITVESPGDKDFPFNKINAYIEGKLNK
jgi:hypothetical protein